MSDTTTATLKYILAKAPSPCFILDQARLIKNAGILANVQNKSGCKILLALKCFAAWDVFPCLSRQHQGPLWGVCASSVDEARLGREKFGGEVHAFAAAWSDEEMRELIEIADHIVFNSPQQWLRFKPLIASSTRKIKCGLRINPEHSEGATALYNPCDPKSRLGIRKQTFDQITDEEFNGISGLHFHTLCEQGADALQRTLAVVNKKFKKRLSQSQWINFGGGHHITKKDYDLNLLQDLIKQWQETYKAQIYLEPGEAVALDAGWLVCSILDIIEADMPIAILDISATCHMPDVLEMPYKPDLYYEYAGRIHKADDAPEGFKYRLAGKSCLAGDVIGEYIFNHKLETGQKLIFADMAIYSMVKTTTFNGLRLPSIGICENSTKNINFRLIRAYGYEDFKNRLS